MTDSSFCYHGHFYQPPRGNPSASRTELQEADAAPFRNWYEKVAADCYTPNADLGNFGMMSFDVGASLLDWLEANLPRTCRQIVDADREAQAATGVGLALAQPAHHTVLPLAGERDKNTQIRWGLARFQHRYGRAAEGMWLPEMAVDLKTLQALARHGVRFTVLGQKQINDGAALRNAGPFRVALPDGGEMGVYVRNDALSNTLAYDLHNLGGAGRWSRDVLVQHRKGGQRLTLIATDGETFGHHHWGEEHFLHWLLRYEAGAAGYLVTTLTRDFRDNPPRETVEVLEDSSWSCDHRLARWSEGCACTPGGAHWKSALRRALDALADALDTLYEETARAAGVDPWALRDDYIRVLLGQVDPPAFLGAHGIAGPDSPRAVALLDLLRAQFHRLRMYVSSTFSYEDLDRPEPRYAIANALAAARLAGPVAGADLTLDLRRKLALAVSSRSDLSGADLLDEAQSQTRAA